MKTFFIVTTSQFSTGFYVHSKYDQLPQMFNFKTTKQAKECAEQLNKDCNSEYNDTIKLTENKNFNLGVEKFITNY